MGQLNPGLGIRCLWALCLAGEQDGSEVFCSDIKKSLGHFLCHTQPLSGATRGPDLSNCGLSISQASA